MSNSSASNSTASNIASTDLVPYGRFVRGKYYSLKITAQTVTTPESLFSSPSISHTPYPTPKEIVGMCVRIDDDTITLDKTTFSTYDIEGLVTEIGNATIDYRVQRESLVIRNNIILEQIKTYLSSGFQNGTLYETFVRNLSNKGFITPFQISFYETLQLVDSNKDLFKDISPTLFSSFYKELNELYSREFNGEKGFQKVSEYNKISPPFRVKPSLRVIRPPDVVRELIPMRKPVAPEETSGVEMKPIPPPSEGGRRRRRSTRIKRQKRRRQTNKNRRRH